MNVWVPDDLHRQLREQPDVNLSRLLQGAIRGLIACDHEQLACATCSAAVDPGELADTVLSGFYSDLMWRFGRLVRTGGTVEGAARVARDVAERWGIAAANRIPLPRPSRATRESEPDRVVDLREDNHHDQPANQLRAAGHDPTARGARP